MKTISQIIDFLEHMPQNVLSLPARFAIATVFWNSGQTKIADWNATLFLFTEEYHVPLLPPDLAAYLAAGVELTSPILLVLGLATRLTCLTLLGMTATIQLFVYPQAWPVHIQWLSMLLLLLCRGPGSLSLDWLIKRRFDDQNLRT
jgi:putative oxidoreductase